MSAAENCFLVFFFRLLWLMVSSIQFAPWSYYSLICLIWFLSSCCTTNSRGGCFFSCRMISTKKRVLWPADGVWCVAWENALHFLWSRRCSRNKRKMHDSMKSDMSTFAVVDKKLCQLWSWWTDESKVYELVNCNKLFHLFHLPGNHSDRITAFSPFRIQMIFWYS